MNSDHSCTVNLLNNFSLQRQNDDAQEEGSRSKKGIKMVKGQQIK